MPEGAETMPCVVPGCEGTWLYIPGMRLRDAAYGELSPDRMCDRHREERGFAAAAAPEPHEVEVTAADLAVDEAERGPHEDHDPGPITSTTTIPSPQPTELRGSDPEPTEYEPAEPEPSVGVPVDPDPGVPVQMPCPRRPDGRVDRGPRGVQGSARARTPGTHAPSHSALPLGDSRSRSASSSRSVRPSSPAPQVLHRGAGACKVPRP